MEEVSKYLEEKEKELQDKGFGVNTIFSCRLQKGKYAVTRNFSLTELSQVNDWKTYIDCALEETEQQLNKKKELYS